MQVSGLPFNSSKHSSVGVQNHWLGEGCQGLFYLLMDHRLWGHCPCEEEGCHHDLEMPVSIKADSSFLQALLHRPPHHTANSTHPPENSSQAYFVFLTGDHAPPLRATVISQGRQLSRQSIPIHLEKRWAIQGHVWSFSFWGAVISGPLKALSLAPLGHQTEHHSVQQLTSRVRTVFSARQALGDSEASYTQAMGHAHTGTLFKQFH